MTCLGVRNLPSSMSTILSKVYKDFLEYSTTRKDKEFICQATYNDWIRYVTVCNKKLLWQVLREALAYLSWAPIIIIKLIVINGKNNQKNEWTFMSSARKKPAARYHSHATDRCILSVRQNCSRLAVALANCSRVSDLREQKNSRQDMSLYWKLSMCWLLTIPAGSGH